MKILHKKTSEYSDVFLIGGAGGIRTLAPVTQSNDLANRPLQPLEYRSIMKIDFALGNKCLPPKVGIKSGVVVTCGGFEPPNPP